MRHSKLLLLAFTLTISTLSYADTLLVPSEYGSIQEGIDAAVEGDTVQVADGTYSEMIVFTEVGITVISETGAENTIIDGSMTSGSVVTFEEDSCILDGFTVSSGNAEDGAGVYSLKSLTIQNCILSGNAATRNGGGIFIDGGTLSLDNVTFNGNTSKTGGGVYMRSSSGSITSTLFEHNSASLHSGGLYIKDSEEVTISNVTFEGNSADSNGGAVYNKNSTVTVQDSIFSLNKSNQGGGWFGYQGLATDFSNTFFNENEALGLGGAAYFKNSDQTNFFICTFDSNISDSDCDGEGGSGAIYISGTLVTLEDPTICTNLACDEIDDFSDGEPTIIGDILGCSTGIGACCGGTACWEMDYTACLEGGGVFSGEDTICEMVECLGSEAGGCCLNDTCIMAAAEIACLDVGGEFHGALVECEDVECYVGCPEDINGNGSVDVLDIIELISAWGACP